MFEDSDLLAVTALAVIASFAINREKTLRGLHKGATMLLNVIPQFLIVIVMVSVLLSFVSSAAIGAALGQSSALSGTLLAAVTGSVALIPGPIAYPLAGILVEQGVALGVVAVFTTTLMMVGVLTFPVERTFLGWRLALLRNALSFLGALGIGLLIGMVL
ncbi:MAG: hypothetical protein ACLFUF_05345 [Opitutales bacterium]